MEVIRRGFPELIAVEIKTNYKNLPDAYFEFTRFSRKSYLIEVDNFLKHVKKEVVLGGISHELAHIKREASTGIICSFLDEVIYNNLQRYQRWDERRTDLLVVERGLGPELLEFLIYADKRREKYTSQDGLTVKELENLLRKRAN